MIYFYEHKSGQFKSEYEIILAGYQGVYEYASKHDMSPSALYGTLEQLEKDIQLLNGAQFDFSSGENLALFNEWVDQYINYFNSNARYEKQAYVLIGNIASGKNTFAQTMEEPTGSIIVDADRFKMGEETRHGFFKGFTSLYHKPTDREQMQDMCAEAGKQTMRNVADLGMNLILPKAPTSLEKLEKQIKYLREKNYDVHLILFDTPVSECVNRSYLRYLVKEYGYERHSDGSLVHGRFVPKSVVMSIGDGPFTTFAKAMKTPGSFASYRAFHNDKNKANEEIDLSTMILPEK